MVVLAMTLIVSCHRGLSVGCQLKGLVSAMGEGMAAPGFPATGGQRRSLALKRQTVKWMATLTLSPLPNGESSSSIDALCMPAARCTMESPRP